MKEALTEDQIVTLEKCLEEAKARSLDRSMTKFQVEENVRQLYRGLGMDEPEMVWHPSRSGLDGVVARIQDKILSLVSERDILVELHKTASSHSRFKSEFQKDLGTKIRRSNLRDIMDSTVVKHLVFGITQSMREKEYQTGRYRGYYAGCCRSWMWLAEKRFWESQGIQLSGRAKIFADFYEAMVGSGLSVALLFNNFVVLAKMPKIYIAGSVLHRSTGKAVEYEDGFGYWFLNGAKMTKSIVTTPSEDLDVGLIFQTRNAQQRREILSKIGLERFLKTTPHLVIDTVGEYQLIEFSLPTFVDRRVRFTRPDGKRDARIESTVQPMTARALKMKNASVPGVYHIEGVPSEIASVQEALNWRNEDSTLPSILT